jgi:hypothetical protein
MLPAPFLTTDLGTKWQVAAGGVTDSTLSSPVSYWANSAGLGFDLQVAILDRLSILSSASAQLEKGYKADMLRVGVIGAWDWSIGARYKVYETQRWLASTDLQFIGSGSSGLSVRSLPTLVNGLTNTTFRNNLQTCVTGGTEQEVKTACDAVYGKLYADEYTLGAHLGFAAAVGINSVIGVWWNSGYSHWFRSATNPLNFKGLAQAGMGVSVDLGQATSVPIGLVFATQYSFLFDYDTAFQRKNDVLALSTGVFYTGSRFLSLGLQVTDEITPTNVPDVVKTNWLTAVLTLRYYWN